MDRGYDPLVPAPLDDSGRADGLPLYPLEAAGNGVVTLAEYEVTMALVGSGAEFEPGWEQYVDALAAEVVATRQHEDELIVVSAHWGGNWPPVARDPDTASRAETFPTMSTYAPA